MNDDETIESMFARFQTIIGELKALGKTYENKDLVRKILRSLPKRWRPKVTAIQEAKDLKTLQLDQLLGSLKTHEVELDADEPPKRKMTALKAETISSRSSSKRHSKKEKSDSESEPESATDDELDFMTKQFKKFYKKNRRGQRKRYDRDDKQQKVPVCYHCKKPGHMKSECSELKNERSSRRSSYPKKKVMMATWEDLDSDASQACSDSEEKATQEANLCLMGIGSDSESGSDSEQDENEVNDEYESLLIEYNEMFDELVKWKDKCLLYRKQFKDSEKKIAQLEKDYAILDSKCQELVKQCQDKDYEIGFYKTEINRLNLQKEKSHSPPVYEKMVASSQRDTKGLGCTSKDKGKKVIVDESLSLDPKEKMKQEMLTRFEKSTTTYQTEIIDLGKSSKQVHAFNKNDVKSTHAHVHASYKKQGVKPTRPRLHDTKVWYNKGRSWYYKHAPANTQGPKRVWVPKNQILPFTYDHMKGMQEGVFYGFWVLATHDGEQVLVPRSFCA